MSVCNTQCYPTKRIKNNYVHRREISYTEESQKLEGKTVEESKVVHTITFKGPIFRTLAVILGRVAGATGTMCGGLARSTGASAARRRRCSAYLCRYDEHDGAGSLTV